MGKGTGFEKFEKTLMGESPIDLSLKRTAATEPAAGPAGQEGRGDDVKPAPVAKEPAAEPAVETSKEPEKEFQFGVHVDQVTRQRIDELKFKTGMKIRELIIEAVADLYVKKIG